MTYLCLDPDVVRAIDRVRGDMARKDFVIKALVAYGVSFKSVMRPCKHCGRLFGSDRKGHRYCSASCRVNACRKRRLAEVTA